MTVLHGGGTREASPEDVRREKAALRAELRAARRSKTREAHFAASWAIFRTVRALLEPSTPGTVLGFWPITAQREIDMVPLLDDLVDQGLPVALPVVLATRPVDGSPSLSAHRYAGRADLRPGPWGLLEPGSGIPVPRDEIGVVLVPALALDADGHRLGYGMGHYDRFLAGLHALRIGLVFEEGYRSALPFEPHDERVHLVVTERRLVRTLGATWSPRERTYLRIHSNSAYEYTYPTNPPYGRGGLLDGV